MSSFVPTVTHHPASIGYQPAWRRPIATVFRRTAHAAVQFCVRRHIHADTISYSSIVASALAAACLVLSVHSFWLLLAAPVFCYVRLWLNMLDGMVALAARQASPRGEILNDLPDRISDVLIFAGLAHSGLASAYSGYWVAILALMTAYVGTLGQAVGVQREFSGIMSKPWRMVALHVGVWSQAALGHMATWAHGHSSTWTPGHMGTWTLTILDYTCIVIAAGCVQTIAIRLRRILAALQTEPSGSASRNRRASKARTARLRESGVGRVGPTERPSRGMGRSPMESGVTP
jgi:phosphatidylglycerophosphate synthase